MTYKICEYCGKEFEPSTSNQKHCSRDCGIRNWNKRGYAKIKASREGYTAVKGKMLADWCNENGDEGQKLLAEYSYKNKLSSEKVLAGSNKKVYWKCSTCGYEWEARIENRTKLNRGCPSCAGCILETNNLYLWCMKNGERGQRILVEYSLKNKLLPEEIAPMSGKKVYWECSICGYEWKAVVSSRTKLASDCPSCAGRETETNNLYLWCMENEEQGQRLLSEYSSKNELTYEEIAPMYNGKVWWKCSTCGYEWEAVVANRTSCGCGCPNCNKTSTSYGEQILYYILQRELKEHKVLNRAKIEGYEVDVFVPDLKFGIEYSGYNYHADKVEQDNIKREALKDAGYNVITILEKRSTDGDLDCDFSFVRDNILNPDEMLNYLKSYMKENYNLYIDISLSDVEKEVCKKNSTKQYIDIDEVILLQASGKKTKEVAEVLNCTTQLLWHRKRFFTEEELAQKEDDIGCIVLGTKFGDSAEKIASDFGLDIDFVKKIRALIEKHKN